MKFVINTNYEKANHLLAWIIKDIKGSLPVGTLEMYQTLNHPEFSKVRKDKGEPYVINLLVNYIDKATGAINIDIPNNYMLSTIGNNLVRNLKENGDYLMYLTNTLAVVDNKVSREDLSIRIILPKSKIFHQQGTQLIEELGIAIMSVLDPFKPYKPNPFKLAYESMEEFIDMIPEESIKRQIEMEYTIKKEDIVQVPPEYQPEELRLQPKTLDDEIDDLMSDFEEVDLEEIKREPITAEPPKGLFEEKKEEPVEEKKPNTPQPQKSVFGGNNNNKNKKKNKNK